MAEAARRVRESDVVRRLMARPIRLDATRLAAARAGEDAAARPPASEAGDPARVADAAGPEGEALVERLQAEMALMKAVLMAERAETAALRARIAGQPETDALGAEPRAARDRFAGPIDRMLASAR